MNIPVERNTEAGKIRRPPSPPGNFLLGHLIAFQKDRLGFLEQTTSTYGDVVALRFANIRGYLLAHPDAVEEVLVTQNKNFVKNVTEQVWFVLLGNGLLLSEGDFWRRQRRLMQPAFHRERIAGYGQTMVAFTERMLAGWRSGETRDIHADLMRLTLEIVAQTLFSADLAGQARTVGDALEVLLDEFAARMLSPVQLPMEWPTPGNRRFRRAVSRLEAIISDMVRQRRAANEAAHATDLLQMLLDAQDEDGSRMTDRQLRDELMTLILAGHETTANALAWTWYLLAQNPSVEARLAGEVQAVLSGRAPQVADLPRLRYAEQVIKESMRLYPPVWFLEGRRAVRDCTIAGYHVPAGTVMFLSPWVVHRDARFFSQPERFLPERWTEPFTKGLHRYAYFPFGGGPRLCIGQPFAMMEATLILATVVQRYRLSFAAGNSVMPQPSITLRPSELRMIVQERG
jgi:cytochrome P450